MKKDRFQQLRKMLRAFLEVFERKEHFEEIRKKGHEIFHLLQQMEQPHLKKEAKKFIEDLERFFSHPEDRELAEQIAKNALHLEQETREI